MLRRNALFSWENILLFTLCFADMLTTLFWVHAHMATEANPWMNYWLERGDLWFCGAKLMSFVPFLLIAAYYRPTRPRLISLSLRVTILLYIAAYSVSVLPQVI